MATSSSEQVLFDEQHLFRSVSQIGALATLLHAVASLIWAPSWIALAVDLVVIVGIGLSYAYTRGNPERMPDVLSTLLVTQLLSLVLWFGMGGMNGPGIAINSAAVVVYLLLDTKQRYALIGGLMVAFTSVALVLEYLYPSWVPTYASVEAQALYIGVTFVCLLLLIMPVMRYVLQRTVAEQQERLKVEMDRRACYARHRFLIALKELQEYVFLGDHSSEHFQSLLKLLLDYTESSYGFLIAIGQNQPLEPLALLQEGKAKEADVLMQPSYWSASSNGTPPPPLHWRQQFQQEGASTINAPLPVLDQALTGLQVFPIYYKKQLMGMIGLGCSTTNEKLDDEDLALFRSTYGTVLYNRKVQQDQESRQATLRLAKEEAEQASDAQKQFFTNISHELRTPLSLIVGPISALLSRPQDPPLSVSTKTSLDMVLRNSKKMLRYVNDIMDLSKISDNSLTLDAKPNHLYTLMQGIYQAFEIQTHYRSVDFQFNYEADRELVAELDAEKLEKIINNLLSNAFKYTPDGGSVILTVEERPAHLHFEVVDTGTGIAPEDLPRVFERFYQIKKAQQISVAGTGVGLALAQELTQLHGGTLQVESEVQKGTQFFFDLPLNRANLPKTATPLEQLPQHPDRPNILIVEDNRDMAQFIQLVLQNDYNITVAYNGAQGWERLQASPNHYQLLITDLMMPEMDGFELLERIKATDWGSSLPTIVLTARADVASKLKALTIGIDEYLTKPFSVEELTLHVRNLMENAAVRQTTAEQPDDDNEDATQIDESASDGPRLTPIQREKINQAREVVLENVDDPDFGVEILARSLATSKRQLYRFMQLHTGLTPLKFINEIRLQEARRMLEQGLCSTVKEVSYSIGFLSTRHFSKTYAKRFGKKPSEYFR